MDDPSASDRDANDQERSSPGPQTKRDVPEHAEGPVRPPDPERAPELDAFLSDLQAAREAERTRSTLDQRINLRITEEEKRRIQQLSAQFDVTSNQLVRLLISGQRPDLVAARSTILQLYALILRFSTGQLERMVDEEARTLLREMVIQARTLIHEWDPSALPPHITQRLEGRRPDEA